MAYNLFAASKIILPRRAGKVKAINHYILCKKRKEYAIFATKHAGTSKFWLTNFRLEFCVFLVDIVN